MTGPALEAGVLTLSEWKRKAVHAGMAAFALLLKWLDWRSAAVLAALALVFNLLVMPRIGRGIYRDPSRSRDTGIVAYPAMVLLLILLFRHDLAAAAALWGMMAFGDPAATIVGRRIGGPTLPWNPGKRWSGLAGYFVAGTSAALAFWGWVCPPVTETTSAAAVLVPAGLLGAFLESLDSGLDDNWIPPVPCALLLAYGHAALQGAGVSPDLPAGRWAAALAVNGVIGYVTYRLHIVSGSGAVAGAVVGALILGVGGWGEYGVLWTFFLAGTIATRAGYARKRARGTAQAGGGRRGARHVIANCSIPAACAVLGALDGPVSSAALSVAFAAALAAALADTLGTEIGSLYGARPVSPVTLRAVAPGTPGAVSIPGLAGGLAGALAIAAAAGLAGIVRWDQLWIVAVAGVGGSLAESILGDSARLRGLRIEHEFANAFNTFLGALAAIEIVASLEAGRLQIPFESVHL